MAGSAPWAEPRRGRSLIPVSLPRRGQLIAVCAVTIVGAHLLLAPLTLLLTAVFAVTSRVSRWRMWWLLGPTLAGLAWTLALGPDKAVAGFIAGPSDLLAQLDGHARGIGHSTVDFAGMSKWLPRQFPIALPLAAAEAALVGWLDWLHTDEWAVPPPRPGVLATTRRAIAARAIRAGAVLTTDGCALGVVPSTGAIAELRWAELARGAIVVGAESRPVTLAGLQLVHAALRRRKPVIVFDPGDDASVAHAVEAGCAATGVPLLTVGAPGDAGYAKLAEPSGQAAGSAGPAGHGEALAAGASSLWGRGPERGSDRANRESDCGDRVPVDVGLVVRDRLAALLPADSAERAAGACAQLAALARDLSRIEVDGDAFVWVPHGERVPARALAEVLRDGRDAGLAVLIGTTSPAAAAELSVLTGTVLVYRVADPDLAHRLAARTGTRLLPRPLAATASPSTVSPAAAAPGGLVPSPMIAPRALLALGPAEFVLAVTGPRQRLIAAGKTVPARLPRPAPGEPTRTAGSDRPQVRWRSSWRKGSRWRLGARQGVRT